MKQIAPKLTDYLEVAVANAPEQFRPMGRELRALKAVYRAAERYLSSPDEWDGLARAVARARVLSRLRAPERP